MSLSPSCKPPHCGTGPREELGQREPENMFDLGPRRKGEADVRPAREDRMGNHSLSKVLRVESKRTKVTGNLKNGTRIEQARGHRRSVTTGAWQTVGLFGVDKVDEFRLSVTRDRRATRVSNMISNLPVSWHPRQIQNNKKLVLWPSGVLLSNRDIRITRGNYKWPPTPTDILENTKDTGEKDKFRPFT